MVKTHHFSTKQWILPIQIVFHWFPLWVLPRPEVPYKNALNTVELVIDVLTHSLLFWQVLSLTSSSLLHQEPGNTEHGLETDSFWIYKFSEIPYWPELMSLFHTYFWKDVFIKTQSHVDKNIQNALLSRHFQRGERCGGLRAHADRHCGESTSTKTTRRQALWGNNLH